MDTKHTTRSKSHNRIQSALAQRGYIVDHRRIRGRICTRVITSAGGRA